MAEDREEIAVHAMTPINQRGPVFYASLPFDAKIFKGHEANGVEARRRLISILWHHLSAMNNPSSTIHSASSSPAFPIQVDHDRLGKPHLLLGAHQEPGPAISFSEGGGKVWAALCGDESNVGIDVADTVEFQGEYPFARVFHAEELQHAMNLTDGDLQKAAALLWSVKEAVVKALGCAFNLVAPLQIHVQPAMEGNCRGTDDADVIAEDDEYIFPVRLSGKALARFPIGAGQSLWAHSFPQAGSWLSIAVLHQTPPG